MKHCMNTCKANICKCNKTRYMKQNLHNHNKKYNKCEKCNKTFINESKYHEHIENNYLICQLCLTNFNKVEQYIRYVKMCDKERSTEYDQCDPTKPNKSNYMHQRKNTECDICHKTFSTPSNLHQHEKNVTELPPTKLHISNTLLTNINLIYATNATKHFLRNRTSANITKNTINVKNATKHSQTNQNITNMSNIIA